MRKQSLLILIVAVLFPFQTSLGQKRLGVVCGDPTAACKAHMDNFQPADLPFDQGKNLVIYESQPFYGIVLKSVKLADWGDCANPTFKEPDRAALQALFEHNKVFMQNCVESGSYYYTGVADKTALVAVYAGRTLAEANKFLKTVQALNKFAGARVRKMRVSVNGT